MTIRPREPANPNQKMGTREASDQTPAEKALPPIKDFEMRIAADGTWYHQGRPIARTALAKLFSTVLRLDAAGAYWLQTPVERGRILVEDLPFTAVEVENEGEGEGQILRLRTNFDDWITVDAAHPLRVEADGESAAPRPSLLVRTNLEARLLRPVFYHLVELAVENAEGHLGVWSSGAFFRLDPAAA